MSMNLEEFIYEGGAIVGTVREETDNTDLIEKLKHYTTTKEVFTVRVSGLQPDAVTANVFGEYMGIIPKADVSSRMYMRHSMDELIGKTIPVCMKSFDLENKTVRLSREIAIKKLRSVFLEGVLPKLNEINKEGINYKNYLTKFDEAKDPFYNDYPIVKAKVISVDADNKKVVVNVAGMDILGFMSINMFDYKYIYNPEQYLEEYLEPNRVIDVALLHYYDNSSERRPSNFAVSRRHTLQNPWIGIKNKIKEGDQIIVTALQKNASHFFGSYDNFELDIKCYYPEKPESIGEDTLYGRRLVTVGNEYLVKVQIVNEKTRVLTASYVSEL